MNGDLCPVTQDKRDEVVAALELIAESEAGFFPDETRLRKLLGDIIWIMATDTLLLTPEQQSRIDEVSAEDYLVGIDKACDVAKLIAKALSKNEDFRKFVSGEQEFDLTMGDIAQQAIREIAISKRIPESKLMLRYGFFLGCHELITTGFSYFYQVLQLSND
jgi:hypothetical protein